MKPCTLLQLAEWSGGRIVQGDPGLIIPKLTTDSRTLQSGEGFIALRGERFDGHTFIAQAAIIGAVAALLSELPSELPQGIALVLVDDTLKGLQRFASNYRLTLPVETIAVTGSSGKTSTKQFIAAVLATRFKTGATVGNLNNHIGVPLTLLSLDDSHEYGVVEMGMNHAGELAPLVAMARPLIGVITNIGLAHIENFPDQMGIGMEKTEVIASLPRDGVAILDATDVFSVKLSYRCPGRLSWVRATLNENASEDSTALPEWMADEVTVQEDGVHFRLTQKNESVLVRLPVLNRVMVKNALLAAAVGGECGMTLTEIARGLEAVTLPGARMSVTTHENGVTFINDAYNANPDSMEAALDSLREFPKATRRLAILGSMGELGHQSCELHERVGKYAAKTDLAALVTVGPSAADLARGAELAGYPKSRIYLTDDAAQATTLLHDLIQPGDVVLVKGSHFMRLDVVAENWSTGGTH